jgi:adenosyl cobinamide kinase/adenosyl cobinamide phosphate guanylyltransferase
MAALIFVTGGARSGKSRYALERAVQVGGDAVSFIATAEASDAEMTERIARHRAERNGRWQTLEAPLEVERALENAVHNVVVLECLSLWVSNLMLHGLDEPAILGRVAVLQPKPGRTLIVVSNEVGWGIVPDNALARTYRDVLGRANQQVGRVSSEAQLIVAGLAVCLK